MTSPVKTLTRCANDPEPLCHNFCDTIAVWPWRSHIYLRPPNTSTKTDQKFLFLTASNYKRYVKWSVNLNLKIKFWKIISEKFRHELCNIFVFCTMVKVGLEFYPMHLYRQDFFNRLSPQRSLIMCWLKPWEKQLFSVLK